MIKQSTTTDNSATILFLLPLSKAERNAQTPPLGILQLAALLIEKHFEVEIIDPLLEHFDLDKVKEILLTKKFNILGLTGFSANYWFLKEISIFLHNEKKDIPIMAGGPVAAATPELLLKNTSIDVCALGEGEPIIIDLVTKLLANQSLAHIPGIAYKKHDEIILNSRIRTTNLDELPLPAYHLVDLKRYSANRPKPVNLSSHLENIGRNINDISLIMPIQTQRGCPYACHFCSKDYGRKLFRHSVDYVLKHLDYLNEKYGYNHFKFIDDAFNIPNRWVVEFCEKIIESGRKYFFWPSGNRADFITDDLLEIMKKAGFYQLSVGVESFNQNILDEMNKRLKLDKLINGLELLKKHGLLSKAECVVQFGWPSDNHETMKQNLKYINHFGLDKVGFYYPCPLPNTVLFDLAMEKKKITNLENYLMLLSSHNLSNLLINVSQ
jgi:anaerobic magnesium-protoporphyrin IX monomethyl ester cyclase